MDEFIVATSASVGQVVGTAATFPLDVAKTRMQVPCRFPRDIFSSHPRISPQARQGGLTMFEVTRNIYLRHQTQKIMRRFLSLAKPSPPVP